MSSEPCLCQTMSVIWLNCLRQTRSNLTPNSQYSCQRTALKCKIMNLKLSSIRLSIFQSMYNLTLLNPGVEPGLRSLKIEFHREHTQAMGCYYVFRKGARIGTVCGVGEFSKCAKHAKEHANDMVNLAFCNLCYQPSSRWLLCGHCPVVCCFECSRLLRHSNCPGCQRYGFVKVAKLPTSNV